MTTSHSPLRVLKAQADHIAKLIKAIDRGENPIGDRDGRLAAARGRPSIKFVVAMDDKFLKMELPWSTIRESSEVGLAEWIIKYMRDSRDAVH